MKRAPKQNIEMQSIDALPSFSRDWALFLDVDGTLIELADRPESVVVGPQVPGLLRALSGALDDALALVTGRQLDVLDELLGMRQLAAAGLHGVEWRLPGENDGVRIHAVDHRFLRRFRRELEALSERYPVLQIEDKQFSLAVHYRQAPHLQEHVETFLRQALSEVHAEIGQDEDQATAFHLMRGHMVAEIKPVHADKGYALREFMQHRPFKGRIPVFIGDDVTDEDGFAVVNEMNGVSIKVGRGDTRAHHRISGPADVLDWLGAYRDFLYA